MPVVVSGWALWLRHARRAGQVLAAALLVSVATYLLLGDEYIRFGILHCIGFSMLLAPLFVRLGRFNLMLGAAVVVVGLQLTEVTVDQGWLFPLGLRSGAELGVDYYPLLPLVRAGADRPRPGSAALSLRSTRSLLERVVRQGGRIATPISAPGRHALPIYLLHQVLLFPAVAAALWLAGIEIDSSAI